MTAENDHVLADKEAVSLVPHRLGKELFYLTADGATAMAGTGFCPDNEQHNNGSDALRYAIAIQQHRDDKNFIAADAARDLVENYCIVMQDVDQTTVITHPPHWSMMSAAQKASCKGLFKMNVKNGIIYDASGIWR